MNINEFILYYIHSIRTNANITSDIYRYIYNVSYVAYSMCHVLSLVYIYIGYFHQNFKSRIKRNMFLYYSLIIFL